jgi:peptidoglycan/LPS O-acetylase OafA/YrhL
MRDTMQNAEQNAVQDALQNAVRDTAQDTLWRPPPLITVPETRRRRVPALDGLRALAIVAVLCYHADLHWARGGYLGVDVFFVLSGFLITGLLVGEHSDSGRVDLRRFYFHRARRLLPALFTMLAGVCIYVVLVLPQEAATFRGDAAAALGYATNWWLILRGQSYFGGTGRPSLLLNLWSLAVEEQFYLLWPPVLRAMLDSRASRRRGGGRPSRWPAFCWTVALAAGSAFAMKAWYSPWKDPSRVYYGSDTRAFELFAGAALALACAVSGTSWTVGAASRRRMVARDVLGVCALGALGFAVAAVPATTPWLYPAGLLAVCGAAILAIRAATAGGLVAGVLARRPLVWLGERSYSLYLWHWPVFAVTRPGVDVPLPVPADFALRVAVSLLLAHLTFQYVERPIRGGAIGRVAARCRAELRERRFSRPVGAATLALSAVVCAVGLGNSLIDTAHSHPVNPNAVAVDSGPALTLAAPTAAPRSAATVSTGVGTRTRTGPSAIPTAMPAPPRRPPRVAFVGDSLGMTLLLNKPANLGEYLDAIDDTTEGCGFLGGDISSRDGERRDLDADCRAATAAWASRVKRQHPDIVVLMIGGWDEFDERVGGVPMAFGSASWDAYYTSRLAGALSGLKAAGVPRIELALLPCYRPVPESGSGYWPERGDDSRTRHVNALLSGYARYATAQATAAAEPRTGADSGISTVITLQPPAAFCTDARIARSLSYRWDGTHYYKPGSALYFRSAIPQLLAPP